MVSRPFVVRLAAQLGQFFALERLDLARDNRSRGCAAMMHALLNIFLGADEHPAPARIEFHSA